MRSKLFPDTKIAAEAIEARRARLSGYREAELFPRRIERGNMRARLYGLALALVALAAIMAGVSGHN